MKKITTLLLLIITLSSYSQITKQTTFNQKSENYLNKSSDVLHQKDSIEKLIPLSEFEDSMRDADFFKPKQSKNTTLYLKANSENTIRLDSLSTVDINKDGISGKSEYAYDENGNWTLQISYNWDADSAAFLLDGKNESAYDENNTQIGNTELGYNSDFGVFVPTKNTVFEFDDQMRVISEERYTIDICNNEKVLTQKIGYKYLDGYEGRSTSIYAMDENGQAFFQYEVGSYYQDGRLALRVQIVNPNVYPPNIYTWETEYIYNENGNQTLYIRNSYDEQTDSLIPDFKKESSYDEDYNLQEEVYSNWYASLGVYKPSIKKEYSIILDTDTKRIREGLLSIYDTNFNQWNTLTDEKYHSYWYYTKSSTLSSESINKDTNVVFPNPTSKFLKVNLSDSILNPFIEIFDITGKKVFSKKIQSGENIDVSSLAPAIYVYKIKDGSTIKKSGKIIKE